jgi:serine/arginine repetitive matrix protein 1
MRKVNLEVLKPWVATRITELLGGVEDEVLIAMVCNLLEETPVPNGRDMFAGLLTFLEKNTAAFMSELWGHLQSAMANSTPAAPLGLPQFLLDAKRDELRARAAAEAKMQEVRGHARVVFAAPVSAPRVIRANALTHTLSCR